VSLDLPRHDLDSMRRIANETLDGHAGDALIDAICEIEELRRTLSGVLKHFENNPHAGDLEWVTKARKLVKQ